MMIRKYVPLCLLIVFFGIKISNAQSKLQTPNTDTGKVCVKIGPAHPLIEKDIYGYYMNFDITIKNQTSHTLELSSVEVAIMDDKGKLALRKLINNQGSAPGINLLVNTVIKPGETAVIFNPFHTFPLDITIASLKYGLYFDFADNQQQKDLNKTRLPVDYDESAVVGITPRVYVAKNDYLLPLKGKIIVWDGHDFYSHNRRSENQAADSKVAQITANSSRYAYDLMSVDDKGSMYNGSPYAKQNWYSFGKPVYAPLEGVVVAVQNNIPDNDFDGKAVKSPKIDPKTDPEGMGNYVILQHANGEYSMMLHLEAGSVMLRPGQMVKAGEEIGEIGFSGSVVFPHLHYSVTNGTKELASEGLPNYFNDYKLFRGNAVVNIKRSRIDSGDIVESDK